MLNAFFFLNIDRELQVNAFSIALSNKANELATNELASVHFKIKVLLAEYNTHTGYHIDTEGEGGGVSLT